MMSWASFPRRFDATELDKDLIFQMIEDMV